MLVKLSLSWAILAPFYWSNSPSLVSWNQSWAIFFASLPPSLMASSKASFVNCSRFPGLGSHSVMHRKLETPFTVQFLQEFNIFLSPCLHWKCEVSVHCVCMRRIFCLNLRSLKLGDMRVSKDIVLGLSECWQGHATLAGQYATPWTLNTTQLSNIYNTHKASSRNLRITISVNNCTNHFVVVNLSVIICCYLGF